MGALKFTAPNANGGVDTFTEISGVFGNIDDSLCEAEVTQGDCLVQRCADEALPFASAGTLHIYGVDGGPYTLEPAADNTYFASSQTLPGALFQAGDLVSGVATGGGDQPGAISAFAGFVRGARSVSVKSPAPRADGSYAIERSQGLKVTWKALPGGPEVVRVNVLQGATIKGLPGSVTISCNFPVAQGSGQLPANLLSNFSAGPATFVVSSTSEQAWKVASGQSVSVSASVIAALAEANVQ
jgi:hypothetical protein